MIEVGIAGLPNAGKSTLFNTLTRACAQCAPYRFTTIKPNIGVAEVEDERLEQLAKVLKPEKVIPAAIKFYDIAGLVKGAHKGEGLGNQFLSEIRTCDVICHCVRGFNLNSEPEPDVKRDVDTVNVEFIFSDIELIERRMEKIKKKAQTGDAAAQEEYRILKQAKNHLSELKPLRLLGEEGKAQIRRYMPDLITLKPVLYVLNVDDPASKFSQEMFEILRQIAFMEGAEALMVAARLQMEIEEIEDEAARGLMAEEFGLLKNPVSEVAKSCYRLGELITFFTTANNICQAWELKKGSTVIEAAGRIHTDFAKNFVKAEIVFWQDLVHYGSIQAAREAGKVFLEGREYVVRDGDVIHFKVNR